MAGTVENKLKDLGIVLKEAPAPVANYVPFVRTGNLLMVSGQLCFDGEGKIVVKGQLGGGVSIEDGQKAAQACAVNLLAQVKAALGDLDRVLRVVRLGGIVVCYQTVLTAIALCRPRSAVTNGKPLNDGGSSDDRIYRDLLGRRFAVGGNPDNHRHRGEALVGFPLFFGIVGLTTSPRISSGVPA